MKTLLTTTLSAVLMISLQAETTLDQDIAKLRTLTSKEDCHPRHWIKLGNLLMEQSREHQSHKLYREAGNAFLNAAAADHKSSEALLGLAWVANSQHEFEKGAQWARKALELDPELPHAYALLGDGAVELGEYEDAFDYYQKALDLKPNLSTYSRAAHLLWLTGNSQKAQWFMRKAIAAGGTLPEHTAWCRAELALMQFHAGALMPARKLIAQALKAAPDHVRVLTIAGRLAHAAGDLEAARSHYQRATESNPQHEALVGLHDLALAQNDEAKTEKLATRIRTLHEKSHAHSDGSKHAHAAGGDEQLARFLADTQFDLERAVTEAEQAYKVFRNAYAADTLAWCYYQAGRHQDARRTMRKALKWKTPDASLLFHAGMIHAALGEKETAKRYLYRALNLNPNFHPRDAKVAAAKLKALQS